MNYLPFLTGSQAYGTPNEESDVDIVVLVRDSEELEEFPVGKYNDNTPTIRIGKLNIILVYNESEYDAWFAATQKMIAWKKAGWPVPREQAILEIDKEHEARQLIYQRANLVKKYGIKNTLDDVPF